MRLKTLVFGACALLGLSVTAPAFAAEELNFVVLASEDREEYDGAVMFKHYVESMSNDEMKVNIFTGDQLCGKPTECFDALDSGTVDVYSAALSSMSVVYPPIALIDIPYLLSNSWEAENVLTGPFQQDLREGLYKYTNGKFMLMTTSNSGGFRGIATTTKEVKTPADMDGLKIRTVENDIAFQDMRNLKASPTPVAYMELYSALQQGVVNGCTNGVMHVVTAKHHDSIKHILNDNRVFVGGFAAMSSDRFRSFSPEQQKILIDAFNRMSVVQFGVQPRKEINCYEDFEKAGGKVYYPTEADMKQFREAEKNLRQLYLDEYGEAGKDLLGKFEKRLAETRAEIKTVYDSFNSLK